MHTRAPLARHRYPLLCHRAHCIVRLRWTSLSSAGRHISYIRACEDARLGVSNGELSGREGSTFFFRVGAHGPGVVFWIFFFDAKHKAEYSNGLEKGISMAGTWLVLFVV
jgi:hypothetical protein